VIDVGGRERSARFLIHDRDTKFSAGFDEVFRTEGIQAIRTPFRAPNANAHAERFVRTLREECLDSLLITGRRQLERVLRECVEHYNPRAPAPSARPATAPTHAGDSAPPATRRRSSAPRPPRRTDPRVRVGGMIASADFMNPTA
jgi:putative transposase